MSNETLRATAPRDSASWALIRECSFCFEFSDNLAGSGIIINVRIILIYKLITGYCLFFAPARWYVFL